MTYIYRDKRFI